MPSLPKRPCSFPGGCAELVSSGRCAAHQQQQAQHVERRGTTAERGYGAQHKRWRIQVFQRDRWRCVDCGWEPELVTIFREAEMGAPPTDRVLEELRAAFAKNARHLHADHIIPVEKRRDLALVLSNGATRCNVCHAAKTAREDHGFGNG